MGYIESTSSFHTMEAFASPYDPPGSKGAKTMYRDTGRVNCMGKEVGDARVMGWSGGHGV